jgi:folate-dependent phosphoribosylglycinamide formyltransferase PurN
MYVDEGADTGQIIDQSAIRIPKGATASELKTLVQKEETKLLEKTILDLVVS